MFRLELFVCDEMWTVFASNVNNGVRDFGVCRGFDVFSSRVDSSTALVEFFYPSFVSRSIHIRKSCSAFYAPALQ